MIKNGRLFLVTEYKAIKLQMTNKGRGLHNELSGNSNTFTFHAGLDA